MSQKLYSCITNLMVKEFFPYLSSEINVDKDILSDCWAKFNNMSDTKVSKAKPKVSETEEPVASTSTNEPDVQDTKKAPSKKTRRGKIAEITTEEALEMNRAGLEQVMMKGLKKACNELNISSKGVTAQLITNILKVSGKLEETSKPIPEETIPKAKKVIATKKPQPTVLEKIEPLNIEVVVNKYGHTIHEETGLVFTKTEKTIDDTSNRIAIGWEDPEDNEVKDLTMEKIELCNKYGIHYRCPENLKP